MKKIFLIISLMFSLNLNATKGSMNEDFVAMEAEHDLDKKRTLRSDFHLDHNPIYNYEEFNFPAFKRYALIYAYLENLMKFDIYCDLMITSETVEKRRKAKRICDQGEELRLMVNEEIKELTDQANKQK